MRIAFRHHRLGGQPQLFNIKGYSRGVYIIGPLRNKKNLNLAAGTIIVTRAYCLKCSRWLLGFLYFWCQWLSNVLDLIHIWYKVCIGNDTSQIRTHVIFILQHISLLSLSVPVKSTKLPFFAFLHLISWAWPLEQIIYLIKTAARLSTSELLNDGSCSFSLPMLMWMWFTETCSFQDRRLFTLVTDHKHTNMNVNHQARHIGPVIHSASLTVVDPDIPWGENIQSITYSHL